MCDSPYSLYRVSGLGSLLALSGDSGGTGSSSLRVQVLATRLDRLLIALTGATIRETITFPLVKPLVG